MHTPKPGNYRELFKRGLALLLQNTEMTEEERRDAVVYLQRLDDPEYKFGKIAYHGGQASWAPGELFMKS